MTSRLLSQLKGRERGLALVIVVSSLALISVLIVAIFSVTRREFKATQSYVSGRSAKQLGDAAVAIVEAQLQNAHNTSTGPNRSIHATQPGMVRQYNANGDIINAFKLYSSSQMQVNFGGGGDESTLLSPPHIAPANWDQNTARYVDLNEPVVRPGAASAGNNQTVGYSVYFPVIDPRAFWNSGTGGQSAYATEVRGTTQVEGFVYGPQTAPNSSGSRVDYSSRTRAPSQVQNPADLRLPMPVEWMYILQDGALGTVSDSGQFTGAVAPSASNPIVGRMAFWADDESCKINVNTASEPTYSASPYYFHDRDYRWAHYPPVTGEYQRYPGHPATVALSPVLAPFYLLDPYLPSQDGLTRDDVVAIKRNIYQLAPKIEEGGSLSGTLPFVTDEVWGDTQAASLINLESSGAERLFASVDEMLFKDRVFAPGTDSATGRQPAAFTMPGGRRLFDHDTIERSRFFLTAHSRSPEFSIHGLPRIAMWPVPDESLGAEKRTTYDNMIALCSTIRNSATSPTNGARSYFFRRAVSEHGSYDVNGSASGLGSSPTLARNKDLIDYLARILKDLQFPATSTNSNGAAGSFSDKYGTQNANQLAVQFFDYIRSSNLYDGILARKNDAWDSRNNYNSRYGPKEGGATAGLYHLRDEFKQNKYTFTSPRISPKPTSRENIGVQQGANNANTSREGTVPGHGQVSPAKWQGLDGGTYKGFGRMFTLSEIGFQFICTADGNNDEGANTSLAPFLANGATNLGGGTAPRFDPTYDARENAFGLIAIGPKDAGAYGPNSTILPLGNLPGYVGANACWYSNFPPLINQADVDAAIAYYGCDVTGANPELHPSKHPGFNPRNWNMSLPQGTPLQPGQKRVQVMLMLETFCPSLGWTQFNPEWTIELRGRGINSMQLNGQILFDTAQNMAIKSYNNIYTTDGVHSVGGHAGPSAIAGGRHTRPISGGGGTILLPSDPNYSTTLSGVHTGLQNFTFVSDFVTVDRNSLMNVTFPSGQLEIWLYDTHDTSQDPVQKIYVDFSSMPTQVPVPHLVGSSSPLPTGSGDVRLYLDNNGNVTSGTTSVAFNGGQVFDRQVKPWRFSTIDSFGRLTNWRSFQGPHYWGGNYMGVLGLLSGRFNSNYLRTPKDTDPWGGDGQPPVADINYVPYTSADTPFRQVTRGRLDNRQNYASLPGASNWRQVPITPDSTSDVIRTMVPAIGDYRIIAAMHEVPATMWKPHPLCNVGPNIRQAHSFSGYRANYESGALFGVQVNSDQDWYSSTYQSMYSMSNQLVGGARLDLGKTGSKLYNQSEHQPDLPPDPDWAAAANAFGDFDAGISDARDGPYINKPDEGNFYAGNEDLGGRVKYLRSSYFYETWQNAEDWRSGIYMTPNRLISSAVMFGSLPTGVWGMANSGAAAITSETYAPWQTLLYRPHVAISNVQPAAQPQHPGTADPSDHYTLDLFCMPVVEPYAISEPLSVAGRINMNYQIMPFTHIRRATGMHALLKGEFMTAIPNTEVIAAKEFAAANGASGFDALRFTSEAQQGKYWHRAINAAATLRQFDLRFNHQAGTAANSQGLFRSASQICDIHLVPRNYNGTQTINVPTSLPQAQSQNAFDQAMENFWSNHRGTGDNVRERPYANIYARLTTRSNTFRVHVRAQMIKKARSVAPATFDPAKDAVVSEYRGSYLVERYIDPNDAASMPDYADGGNPFSGNKMPLDTYYRFRVLETKRFAP